MVSTLQLFPIGPQSSGLAATLRAAGLPVDDLDEPNRFFFRASLAEHSVGFGGYEIYGPNILLRSMVILPAWRGKGLGNRLMEGLLDHAGAQGAQTAYLLTTTAAPFFERAGFVPITREAAPSAITGTRQARDLCPSTASLLSRSIAASHD